MGKYDNLINKATGGSQKPAEAKTVYSTTTTGGVDRRTLVGNTIYNRDQASQAVDPDNQHALDVRSVAEALAEKEKANQGNILGTQLKDRFQNSVQTGYTGGEQKTHQIEKSVEVKQGWKKTTSKNN